MNDDILTTKAVCGERRDCALEGVLLLGGGICARSELTTEDGIGRCEMMHVLAGEERESVHPSMRVRGRERERGREGERGRELQVETRKVWERSGLFAMMLVGLVSM